MKQELGFSLLELLIVMALVAILGVISYPLYTSHLVKARRSQAEVALMYLASQLETFFSLQSTYQGASVQSLEVNPYTDGHFYQLSIQSATESGYVIAATPLNSQAKEDPACGGLFLNELGEKTVSGTKNPDLCW